LRDKALGKKISGTQTVCFLCETTWRNKGRVLLTAGSVFAQSG